MKDMIKDIIIIKNKLYYVFHSGLKVEVEKYKHLKRKMKRKKVKLNFEDYYIVREAKRLLNEGS